MTTVAINPQNESWLSLEAHLVIAGLMLAIEGWAGIGLLGGAAMIVVIVKICGVLFSRSPLRHGLKIAALYLLVCIASMGWILLNWHMAERHAKPIIAAVEEFHAKYQRYPENLNKLTPEFLPAIPRAGLTYMSDTFGYSGASRPELYFSVMFHGMAFYDFQRHAWATND